MKNEGRNRKYILKKEYDNNDANQVFAMNQHIMGLTKKSARLSIAMGSAKTIIFVYCRTDTSKVYWTAKKFGFNEI